MRPGAKRAATSSTTPKVTIGPGPTPRPANTMRRPTIRTTRSATENPARRRVNRAPETTIRTKPRTRRPSEDAQSPLYRRIWARSRWPLDRTGMTVSWAGQIGLPLRYIHHATFGKICPDTGSRSQVFGFARPRKGLNHVHTCVHIHGHQDDFHYDGSV